MKRRMTSIYKKIMDGLTLKKILLILFGAMICTFGIHSIHQRTNITEGGCHWLNAFHWALAKNLSSIHYPRIGYSLLFAGI